MDILVVHISKGQAQIYLVFFKLCVKKTKGIRKERKKEQNE